MIRFAHGRFFFECEEGGRGAGAMRLRPRIVGGQAPLTF
jgi:hypothetical protein